MVSFDKHAFISYAHIDNEPLTPHQQGWVTQFHATLRTMLSQRLGKDAEIWRDPQLSGNDLFADEIIDQFARTATLISIVSPRYLTSEWCQRELNAFCAAAGRSIGVVVGNKSRVFKVVKTPLDKDVPLPPSMQQTLGYDFYADDAGYPQELDPAYGEQAKQQFLRALGKLAYDLSKSLHQLANAQAGAAEPAPALADSAALPERPPIFLAECGRDLRRARAELATALEMHGFEVLPNSTLPSTEDALVPELERLLARCSLSIHLVGSSVGQVPDGDSGQSLVMLQNRVAAERSGYSSPGSGHRSLRRLIWLPAGVASARSEQQAFIDALQRDADLQRGADLLRGDIEELKGAMFAALKKPAAPAREPVDAAGGMRHQQTVHVLMSEADRAAALPLIKLLRAHGLQVTIPVFVGDAASLREANAQLQSSCDAVILFFGTGDGVWKHYKQTELRKHVPTAANGRTRTAWTLLSLPVSADKETLLLIDEPNLIDTLGGLSEAALQPLLTSLAQAEGGVA